MAAPSPPLTRFLNRVELNVALPGTTPGLEGCWFWTGPPNSSGYGVLSVGDRKREVHKWAYEELVGPVPDGLVVDHLCHDPSTCANGVACLHRRCTNPDHMELVTSSENTRRGRNNRLAETTCKNGHPWDDFFWETQKKKYRVRRCRHCRRAMLQRRQERLST